MRPERVTLDDLALMFEGERSAVQGTQICGVICDITQVRSSFSVILTHGCNANKKAETLKRCNIFSKCQTDVDAGSAGEE